MNLLMVGGDTSIVRGRRGALYNTLSEFSRYWERIDILTLHVPGVSQLEVFGNVTIWPSPQGKLLQPWFIVRHGRRLAAGRHYGLIVSHDYGLFYNGLGAARLSGAVGTPYISEIHHVEGYPHAANLREWVQPALTRLYVTWARSRALGFRVTNQAELKPLLRRWGVPERQLHLLYSLYLDFDVFRPAPVRPDYDAIFCGRLVPNKAPFLFLSALNLARRRLGNVRALIVGQGPLGPSLKARAQALGLHVDFVDWVETQADLADLYRRSRCLVCTSYSEGGPRVVAEALACGVPVVTTRVGLAGELVGDGANGFQIGWSAEELAERVAEIAADDALRRRLSQAAPRTVQQFEKSRIVREYALGYQKLVTG